jgi:hypothetical protein
MLHRSNQKAVRKHGLFIWRGRLFGLEVSWPVLARAGPDEIRLAGGAQIVG